MKKALVINCSPVKTGATAEIIKIVTADLSTRYEVNAICIDDFDIHFCKGCRICHKTAACVQKDDTTKVMDLFEWADIVVSVSPSYWADIPGQYKSFIDRCTPWCNTHEPHASLSKGKKGYTIVQRTGPNMKECNRLIETIEHFYGHLEIECCNHIGFCSIEKREDVESIKTDILEFCKSI